MAAWVFPLAVKLLLQRDGYYTLSERDEGQCLAVDMLLAVTKWHKEMEGGMDQPKWQEIVSLAVTERKLERIMQQITKENPQLFTKDRSTEEDDGDK